MGQLALEYQNEKKRLTEEIENVARTFTPIISKALWNVDDEQLKTSLLGVLGINYDVLQVQLLDGNGIPLFEFHSPADKHTFMKDWPGVNYLAELFLEKYEFRYDLFYQSDFTSHRRIGQLVLNSNSNVVLNRASHTFLITIVSAIFKTSLLATIFYIIMRIMVGVPLTRITSAMRRLNPEGNHTGHNGDFGDRLLKRSDELGEMARTFQEMSLALAKKDKALNDYANHLEAKVQERTLELEKASQAKSDFLAAVSHEIRTPMNGIIGLSHLLGETELNEQQRRYLEVMQSSAESLTTIINDILDHLKIESNKIELEKTSFDLQKIIHDSIELFSHKARESNIQVISKFDLTCPEQVLGDPTRIRQILVNLLGNAFKFTESGTITVSASAQGQWINMAVEDTGIGIGADQLERLFKPFSQADSSTTRRYGGTGLGLAICKRLVELMGGEIGVTSKPGRGSRFWFRVPLPPADTRTLPNAAATPSSKPYRASYYQDLSSLTVLVAEDNLVNQMVITGYLTMYGINPAVVTNGRQAIDYCRQHPNEIDLILMDGEMPEIDGWQAAREIRALGAQRPSGKSIVIVAMTAHALETHEEKAIEHGMDKFLAKPIDPEKLSEILLHVNGHT